MQPASTRRFDYTVPGSGRITFDQRTAPRIIDNFIDKIRGYLRELPRGSRPVISSYRPTYIRGVVTIIINFAENPILHSLVISTGQLINVRTRQLFAQATGVGPRIHDNTTFFNNLYDWMTGPIHELNDELFNPMYRRDTAILAYDYARNTGHHLANNSPVYPNAEAGAGAGASGAGAGNTTGGRRKHHRKHHRKHTRRTRRTRRC